MIKHRRQNRQLAPYGIRAHDTPFVRCFTALRRADQEERRELMACAGRASGFSTRRGMVGRDSRDGSDDDALAADSQQPLPETFVAYVHVAFYKRHQRQERQ